MNYLIACITFFLSLMGTANLFAAQRVVHFVGYAKSAYRTSGASPYTKVTLLCNIHLQNVSTTQQEVTNVVLSFRAIPNFDTAAAALNTQYGPAPGAVAPLFFRMGTNAASAAVTNAGLPIALATWGAANDSLYIQARTTIQLTGNVGNAGAGLAIQGRQSNIPQYCVGAITVRDNLAAQSGSVIGSGSIEYVSTSSLSYERSPAASYQVSGTLVTGSACGVYFNPNGAYAGPGGMSCPAPGWPAPGAVNNWVWAPAGFVPDLYPQPDLARTLMTWTDASYGATCNGNCSHNGGAPDRDIHSQIVEGPLLVGYPHTISNAPFQINGGQPF